MLRKLLKYDLKFTFKSVWIFYALSIFFAILTRIFAEINQTTLIIVLTGIARGACMSMMFSSVINNIFACWRRVHSNLYKDEAYLTHTLPVSREKRYTSYLLNAIITIFASMIIAVVSVAIMFYSKENLDIIHVILDGVVTVYDSSVVELLILFFLLICSQIIYIVKAGYTGLILGHRAENKKMGKSVLWGFTVYGLAQWIMLGAIFAVGLSNKEIMSVLTENKGVTATAFKIILYSVGGGYVLFSTILTLVNEKLLKQGVNVE